MPELTEFSDNIFQRLSAMPRYHQLVPFPIALEDGSTFEIAMVVLTQDEKDWVLATAEKEARARIKEAVDKGQEKTSLSYAEIYNDHVTTNTLWMAMRHPREVEKHALPNAQWLLKSKCVNPDTINILYERYLMTALKHPQMNDLSKDELEQWLKDIIRDGTDPRFLVDSFSVRALKDLVIILVSQMQSSQTDTSLSGTPPSNMSSTPTTTTG